MKEFLMGLLFLLGTNLISLQSMAQTEVMTTQEEPALVNLKELIAKVKIEGASWTVDQWKDAIRQVITSVAPLCKSMAALIQKHVIMDSSNEEEKKKLEQETKLFEAKSARYAPLMKEFEKLVEANEVGAKLLKDDDFLMGLIRDLDLEDVLVVLNREYDY